MKTKPRFIAFEGADGVGKSTVMRLAVPRLVKRGGYAGYAFFHWKPVRGGVFEDLIPGDDPHDPRAKAPRPPPASLAFLAYHWIGFWTGYLRYVRPAAKAGQLVVADRSAYDVAFDPRRFRIRLPRWVLALFVRTLPRPDRAVLLHADPQTVRRRKPELETAEIEAYQRAMLESRFVRGAVPADASGAPEEIAAALVDGPGRALG